MTLRLWGDFTMCGLRTHDNLIDQSIDSTAKLRERHHNWIAFRVDSNRVERVKGIEPSLSGWEPGVLPLNYTRP